MKERRIALRIPATDYINFRKICKETDTTISQFIRKAIRESIRRERKKAA